MRVPDWPKCGKSCAGFYLQEGSPEALAAARAASSATLRPVLPPASDFVAGLANLARLHEGGFLNAAEFHAAKQRILNSLTAEP